MKLRHKFGSQAYNPQIKKILRKWRGRQRKEDRLTKPEL